MWRLPEAKLDVYEAVFAAYVFDAVRVGHEWRYSWLADAPAFGGGYCLEYQQPQPAPPRWGVATPGRQMNYAVELNNKLAPQGRYYWMRFKHMDGGVPVFEFCADDWLFDYDSITYINSGDVVFGGRTTFFAPGGPVTWSGQYHHTGFTTFTDVVDFERTSISIDESSLNFFDSGVTFDETTFLVFDGPQVTFNTTTINVPTGQTLTIEGPGTIDLDETTVLIVGGDTTFPSTSTTTWEDGSDVVLESTTWTVQTGDTWTITGSGDTEIETTLFITGSLNYDVTTYPAITANQTALTFPATAFVRWPVNSAVSLFGIDAPDPESTTFFIATNVGTDTFTIADSSGSAGDTAYQLATPDGNDYAMEPGETLAFVYDVTSDKYRIIGPAKSSSPTGTSGQNTLSSTYTVTSSWADTGLEVSLPSAGTYLINAVASGYVVITSATGAGPAGHVFCRLRNNTAGTVVSGTVVPVVTSNVEDAVSYASATISFVLTVGAATTVRLQAIYTVANATLSNAEIRNDSSVGESSMNYVKLA